MRPGNTQTDHILLLSAPGWVGWTNKKFPLEIGFVFTSFQSLQSVSIAVFSKPDMGIMVRPAPTLSYDIDKNTM